MDNQNSATTAGSIVRAMFQATIYKRSQGRYTRSLTAIAVGVVFCMAALRLMQTASSSAYGLENLALPLGLIGVGFWFAFRLVNWPTFADFLISVEAEMAKVSWPSRGELFRSVGVVIVSLILLTAFLFVSDVLWVTVLQWIRVVR